MKFITVRLVATWHYWDSELVEILTMPVRYVCMDCQLLLGDVIISLDTAAKQAAESGHTLLDELRILLVRSLALTIFPVFGLFGTV